MEECLKAVSKQEVISGGDVNYYLEVIPGVNGKDDITVEIEDIIEFFEMNFSSGTVFKSAVRLCKLRKDLGKPGSKHVYEAEKIVYYSKRLLAITKRRFWFFKLLNKYLNPFTKTYKENLKLFKMNVSIKDPKRLPPYTFNTEDFIKALGANPFEEDLLSRIFKICIMRKKSFFIRPGELDYAKQLLLFAEYIHLREVQIESLRKNS